MRTIRVHLRKRSYDIIIGSGLLKTCGRILAQLGFGKDAIIITNPCLSRMYRASVEKSLKKNGFTTRFELVPDSEKAKSFHVAIRLLDRISAYDRYRRVFIIALGGGVVGDLAGFVAAVYKRGIPYVQMPTTLLAQVDSAIGGKTAIDLRVAKNLVGAFHQPKLVISDVLSIRTLSSRQIMGGVGEIIKYGVIKDKGLFEFLEANLDKILAADEAALCHVIARSARIKAELVEKDEFDKKGIRAMLNYGHTIGHAIEAASKYSGVYSHGEAISIGMIAASRIAVKLGMLKNSDSDRIERLIRSAGLPTLIKGPLSLSDIYAAYLHDKKFVGEKNRFVLPAAIGKARVVDDIPISIVRSAIKQRIVQ